MIARIPQASYRIQLRSGVDFDAVRDQLPYLAGLGISHPYLSPIFRATEGSTHGYDVTDPTEIDPVLGGRAGFEALARAAIDRGMGIILDIVPNHTAFNFENCWLIDVLRKGRSSDYARHFDIDWDAGPLVLPMLAEPFEKMLAEDAFTVADGHWAVGEMRIPLAEGTGGPVSSPDDLRALHERQNWRLCHWEIERDGITHRRFFNVTGLIGMRVEDRIVFEDTHSLIFDLVRSGLVHGLRVDHIDGLADPKTYLDWLADALPDVPVWVEKIVVGEERLPDQWKTAGTTGYEAARLIARLLTDPAGLERLDSAWRQHTGIRESFDEAMGRARRDIIENELAAELHHLIKLAGMALAGSPLAEPGPERLREAVFSLLKNVPRYRTYFVAGSGSAQDRALIETIAVGARGELRSHTVLDAVVSLFLGPRNGAAHDFVARFQQVSGALLAKAQEDTAGFRWTRYLAANEVGAEPDEATITEEQANRFLAERQPGQMTLTSTHDTKRSEDSRMRLAAISHDPEAFAALVRRADELPSAAVVSPQWRWYIVQSALALWRQHDVCGRLNAHTLKAMREAKEATFWTRPNQQAEDAACRFAEDLCASWTSHEPVELDRLITRAEALGLAQLGLKVLMPGFPDFYRGTEGELLALTDPDNRLPVDPEALTILADADGYGGEKNRLTRFLLAFRAKERGFLDRASARVSLNGGGFVLRREGGERKLELSFGPIRTRESRSIEWRSVWGDRVLCLFWR